MFNTSLSTQFAIAHQAQVMVFGGGPGGLGAAVAAARNGADVLLIEHYGFLGGMATAGEVHPFMANHVDGKPLDTGIFAEWLDRMEAYQGIIPGTRHFDPYAARLAAEDLCLEAGVRILYHHRPIHVETQGKEITGIVLHGKGGLTGAQANLYIDCTGDGDLAALAGCAFEYGSPDHGVAQPQTLCFKLKLSPRDASPDFDMSKGLSAQLAEQNDLIQEVFKKARAEGQTSNARDNVLMFKSVDRDVIHFNSTRVIHKNAANSKEISQAEIEGRKQMRELLALLREKVPMFKNAKIYSMAAQIGVRETRRILGEQYLTLEAFEHGRTFPDGICRVNYPIDIHSPNGGGTVIRRLSKHSWYEIPYGCLLPKDMNNLLLGSRCISVDHHIHSSYRVMPPVCTIGQAAGTAAAICVSDQKSPKALDGRIIRTSLTDQGVNFVPYNPKAICTSRPEDIEERTPRVKKIASTMTA